MKMGRFEKSLVNSRMRSRRVSRHAERMLELAEFREGQAYLDVGCGNGAAPLRISRQYGLDVTGVDVDAEQIQLAREAGRGSNRARFVCVDATRLPFDDGAFDIVATNMATHHISEWETALAEMVRVLKPGGYFIYADLIWPAWLARIGKKLAGKWGGYPNTPALDAFVERNGLVRTHLSRSWVHYETVCKAPPRFS